MRLQKDECSFVSLRDVERCLKVMVWFYQHDIIFAKMDEIFAEKSNDSRVVADGNEQFGDDGDEDEDDVEEQDDAGGENNEVTTFLNIVSKSENSKNGPLSFAAR